MAGERFHMVQNVSMAVHHIGREPTVRGRGRWGEGMGALGSPVQPAYVCSS